MATALPFAAICYVVMFVSHDFLFAFVFVISRQQRIFKYINFQFDGVLVIMIECTAPTYVVIVYIFQIS